MNRAMLRFHEAVDPLWRKEKVAMVESLNILQEEALTFLAKEREQIMKMTREDAIKAPIADRNIDGRIKKIQAVADNGIPSMV